MYKEKQVFGKIFRAYEQEGDFSCGAAAVCNVHYFLTGRPIPEWKARAATNLPMVTKSIRRKVSDLMWGDVAKGIPGAKKLFDEEDRQSHMADKKYLELRKRLNIPEGSPSNTYLKPSDGSTVVDTELDMVDLRRPLAAHGLKYTEPEHIDPREVLERFKRASSATVFIAGVKWTEALEDAGGGHWVSVVKYDEAQNGVVVLDSISGVEVCRSCPTYVQSGDGESGFFDGWIMTVGGGDQTLYRQVKNLNLVTLYGDSLLGGYGIGVADIGTSGNIIRIRCGIFAIHKPLPTLGTEYVITGDYDEPPHTPFRVALRCRKADRPQSDFS